jgi:hypothetical protein
MFCAVEKLLATAAAAENPPHLRLKIKFNN